MDLFVAMQLWVNRENNMGLIAYSLETLVQSVRRRRRRRRTLSYLELLI